MAVAVAQDIAAADAAATHDGGLVPLQALTPAQLEVLLRSHNLEKVATSFSDQGVRGEDLVDDGAVISSDDLKELGVTVPKQRRQIDELLTKYLADGGVPSSRLGAPTSATANTSTSSRTPAPGTLPSLFQMTTALKPSRTHSEIELKAGVRIVPQSDALQRHTPGLQRDWFTVTPLELVRKATDELTLGLHWFVLMSMVHSSVDVRPDGSHLEIKFDPANVARAAPGSNTTVFNYVGGEYKRTEGSVKHVNPASIETLVDSMSAYQAYAPARDWRMLLRHITRKFDRRYYPEGPVAAAGGVTFQDISRSVEGYLAFFAHRNCNVGDETRADGRSIGFKTRVTVEWAKAALDEMRVLTSVLERQRYTDPRVRHGKEFAKQACKELREAAISHLKAVGKILQIFEEIYQTPQVAVEPRQVLLQLEEQLRVDLELATAKVREAATDDLVAQRGPSDDSELGERLRNFASSEAAMSISSQFALFTLWTRFGMRHPQRDGNGADGDDSAGGDAEALEAECKAEEAAVQELEFSQARRGRGGGSPRSRLKQPGTLSVIRVARHSLQPQVEAQARSAGANSRGEHFVKKTVSFLADPRGVTNLDVIHRALDAATSALHAVLRKAVSRYDQLVHSKPASDHTESDRKLVSLVGKVCGLKDWDVTEGPRPRNAPRDAHGPLGKKYEKKKTLDAESGHPGNRFFDTRSPKTEDVLRFLEYWPGWYDSRHMAEFFDRISSSREMTSADGSGAFGDACHMRRIRDRSFHGFTLLEGESISNVQLKEEVGKLRALVEQVAGVAGVELEQLDEHQALLQLQAALPFYFRWRSSHHLAEKKLEPEERLKKAAAAVRGMRLACEADGGLGKHTDSDASDASLVYLLQSAPSIAALGGTPAAAPPPPAAAAAAAAASAPPPPVKRILSGFKALWADELDEGEDEEGDEGDAE